MYKENKSGPNPCIDHHMHLASGMHGIKTLKQRAQRHSSINYRKKASNSECTTMRFKEKHRG